MKEAVRGSRWEPRPLRLGELDVTRADNGRDASLGRAVPGRGITDDASRMEAVGAKFLTAARSRPRQSVDGYVESVGSKLRDELLNGEIFYSLREAEIVIESWRRHSTTVRPHASLGYKPPAPEVLIPALTAWPAAPARTGPPARLPVAPRPRPH